MSEIVFLFKKEWSITISDDSIESSKYINLERYLNVSQLNKYKKRYGYEDTRLFIYNFFSQEKFYDLNISDYFDPQFYKDRYNLPRNINPLYHFLVIGKEEGLSPRHEINCLWISSFYNVKKSRAFDYLLESTFDVSPSRYFDPIFYLDTNVDVFRSGICPLAHYITSGKKESRNPHFLIDKSWISQSYKIETKFEETLYDKFKIDGLFSRKRYKLEWREFNREQFDSLFEYFLSPSYQNNTKTASPKEKSFFNELYEVSSANFFEHTELEKIRKETEKLLCDAQTIKSPPCVSVIMPTRNRLSKLKSALDSLVNQTYRNLDIIVIDDGGTDETKSLCESYADNRISYIYQTNGGVSKARNKGLENAKGKYISFLDSDNQMTSTFISSMVGYAEYNEESFLYGVLRIYNKNGDIRYRLQEYDDKKLRLSNFIDMNIIFINREKFDSVRFDNELQRCVDWDYVLKLAEIETPKLIKTIGCEYYHESSDVDRITTSKPVCDCFKVLQKHRKLPIVEKACSENSVVVVITKNNVNSFFTSFLNSINYFPNSLSILFVFSCEISDEQYNDYYSFIFQFNFPAPIRHKSPLTLPALIDDGLRFAKRNFNKISIFHPFGDFSFREFLTILSGSSEKIIIVPVSELNETTAISYSDVEKRFKLIRTDLSFDSEAGVFPIFFLFCNIDKNEITDFNLDLGHYLAPAQSLLIDTKTNSSQCKLVKIPTEAQEFNLSIITPELDRLNQAKFSYASLPEKILLDTKYYIADHSLRLMNRYVYTKRKVDLAIFTPAPHKGSGWGDEFYALSLAEAFEIQGVETDIVYRSDWHNLENVYKNIIHLRGIVKTNPIQSANNYLWIISHPDKIDENELSAFSHIFSASKKHTEFLKLRGFKNSSYLPQCTSFKPNPELFSSVAIESLSDKFVFVGDSKKVSRYPINSFIKRESKFLLIGPNWELPNNISGELINEKVQNDVLPYIYSSAAININQHWTSMANGGFVSNRLYDIAASGGVFLTDNCCDIPTELLDFGMVWDGGTLDYYYNKLKEKEVSLIKSQQFFEGNSFFSRAKTILKFLEF